MRFVVMSPSYSRSFFYKQINFEKLTMDSALNAAQLKKMRVSISTNDYICEYTFIENTLINMRCYNFLTFQI